MISPRLHAALGAGCLLEHAGDEVLARVDDVDRRYRDAIKSGATPVAAPTEQGDRRTGVVLDASGNNARVRLWTPAVRVSG